MADKLNRNVWVDGVLHPKGTVPDGSVAARITNPRVWESGQAPQASAVVEVKDDTAAKEPPRGGPGSGADAWRAHADHLGVEYPEGASAKDVAALVDKHHTDKEN